MTSDGASRRREFQGIDMQYTHDCDDCMPLGEFTPPLERVGDLPDNYDLYYCHGVVVARYGSDGPDYHSTDLVFTVGRKCNAALAEAGIRAIRYIEAELTRSRIGNK